MNIVKDRVKWVDYAKAAAIYGVVLLHLGIQNPYRELIDAIVMPVFFFLAGVFFRSGKYTSYSEFFKQRGIKILISYFFFNVVTYLFWLLIGRKVGLDSGEKISPVESFFGIFYGSYIYLHHYIPLWFLACLFTAESIYFFISKIKNKLVIYAAVLFCCIAGYVNYKLNKQMLPWGIDIALVMITFFALGNLLKDKLLTIQFGKLTYIISIITTTAILFSVVKWNAPANVFQNFYGNYWLFYLGGFAGIILFVSLFKMIEEITIPLKLVLFVGENTLTIFALHLLSISFVKAILIYLFKINVYSLHGNLWYTISVGVIVIVALIPVILFVNKYIPFVVGKKKA